MRTIVPIAIVAITALLSAACSQTIVATRQDTRIANTRVLEAHTRYVARDVALAKGQLDIMLERTCEERLEVDTETLTIDSIQYDTSNAWIGVVSVAAIAIGVASAAWISVDDDCVFFRDCTSDDNIRIEGEKSDAATVTYASLGITGGLAALTLFFDLREAEKETVTGRSTEQQVTVESCPNGWPVGEATLTASAASSRFTGKTHGDGKVSIDVASAPAEVWQSTQALQLEIPGAEEWIAVVIPEHVRSAALNRAIDAPKAERAYIRFEGDAKYNDLLSAGTTRVQSVLTNARRFQFVSDGATRKRIEKLVDDGGGSPDDRQRRLLEAARLENIASVFVVTAKPLFESQIVLVLTVHHSGSGDQVYTRDAPADTSDAFRALEVFDGLGQSYLEWASH